MLNEFLLGSKLCEVSTTLVDNRLFSLKGTVKFLWRKIEKSFLGDFGRYLRKTAIVLSNKHRVAAFQSAPVRENSILLVEHSSAHAETMPGLVQHFQQLGFSVDILTTTKNVDKHPFSRLDTSNINIYHAPQYSISEEMLYVEKLKNYEYIMINTRWHYFKMRCPKTSSYSDYYQGIPHPKKKILALEHNLGFMPKNRANIFVLEGLPHDPSLDPHVIYPYYFGNRAITDKNDALVKFIAIGRFEKSRRDHSLLWKGLADLLRGGYSNFKVILIGGGRKKIKIPSEFIGFVDIHYRASYEVIYKSMEEADYFLPLFNPENKEHFSYLSLRTSGSTQLIYTFAKPCIVHEQFASRFTFNEKNSILYADNDGFGMALQKACALPQTEYKAMQSDLMRLADEKRKRSLLNLRNMLGESL
jgi:hypothetical protein